MRTALRVLFRLSNLAFASALAAVLSACGGGGGGAQPEAPLARTATTPSCQTKNVRTGVDYKEDALNNALSTVESGDTIWIWGTCYGNFMINPSPNSSLSLTLQGKGDAPTLDGTGFSSSVLTVAAGANVMINDLMITHGSATNGGGIYNKGTVTMNNKSSVSNNTARYDGGGIYNNGTVTLNGSGVSKNTAGTRGGGIYNNGGTVTQNGGTSVSGNMPDDIYPPLP
jgi:predicted outer membrane repeat protein